MCGGGARTRLSCLIGCVGGEITPDGYEELAVERLKAQNVDDRNLQALLEICKYLIFDIKKIFYIKGDFVVKCSWF